MEVYFKKHMQFCCGHHRGQNSFDDDVLEIFKKRIEKTCTKLWEIDKSKWYWIFLYLFSKFCDCTASEILENSSCVFHFSTRVSIYKFFVIPRSTAKYWWVKKTLIYLFTCFKFYAEKRDFYYIRTDLVYLLTVLQGFYCIIITYVKSNEILEVYENLKHLYQLTKNYKQIKLSIQLLKILCVTNLGINISMSLYMLSLEFCGNNTQTCGLLGPMMVVVII